MLTLAVGMREELTLAVGMREELTFAVGMREHASDSAHSRTIGGRAFKPAR
ncbi:hypothetical protein Pan216_30620 [Planctomycetes bacterium Pan216]|uniref:Uncharacterized protein n=1 Tax=Kolteria novifilia TaxID=2527975 RepID=A0A518B5F2_9BACT|nr:hypothetical protein Pan216_30620 [Planctomycetes bacterium Pan216]